MPELERLMLHRLSDLDAQIRKAYEDFEYRRVVTALSAFMNTELSAFYFDIRKDALYCDAPSSLKRRAALTAIDRIFDCVTRWLAPILVFTAEEAWLSRHGEDDARSLHLEGFPEVPASWADPALAEKWETVKRVRSVITGALEPRRAAKEIGSSLEAAPAIHIADPAILVALSGVDMAEVAITSGLSISDAEAPADAFTLDDIKGVAVVFARASGRKCARSWRYSADVGSDPAWPDVSARDAAALHELKALGRIA
jgi:isoleucyl-tRNA synthetase